METSIGILIAGIDASLFVIECMANVNKDMVSKNTAPLVKIIRKKHPNTPIIFIENIIFESGYLNNTIKDELNNKNIELKYQYNKMLKEGIVNLFYIDNTDAIGADHEGTVDGVHFTDLGFLRYADYLIDNFHNLGVLDLN
jgi:lysophospholipase L1-like esterase